MSGIRGTGWLDLFREIEKVSEYEFLILDLSDCLMDLWEILQSCDHIYTIVREDPLAMAKIDARITNEKISHDMENLAKNLGNLDF